MYGVCAFDGFVGSTAAFGPVVASKEAQDAAKAKKLWELTDKLVSNYK